MKKTLSILLFLLFWIPVKPQDQKLIDSLSVYLKGPDNETKLNAMSDMAWEYNQLDPKKAISLSKEGLKIAQRLKLTANVAQAYADLGTSYFYKRDFDSSAMNYKSAEKIMIELKDSVSLASLYNKMGALYQERGDFQAGLQYSFFSLSIYQKMHNIRKIALLLNNIGITYEELKNYNKAMVYYQQALAYNEQEQDEIGKARNYIGMGNVSTATFKFEQALKYYQESESIFRKEGWMMQLSVVLNNIGNVLDEKGDYEGSVKKRTEALEIMMMGENFFEAQKFHYYIASTLMKAGKFQQAKTHIDAAGKFSVGINSLEVRMEMYEAMCKYAFGTGKFIEGNTYLVKFHQLKDSLYSAQLSKNIAEMEVEKNTSQLRIEKAESEARNLKLQRDHDTTIAQRNYILLAASLAFVLIGLFLFIYLQKRRQNEEKKRIQAMLMSEEKERTRIARELHDGLGQLLSVVKLSSSSVAENISGEDQEILENSIKLVDEAIVEVRHISHNLMPVVLEQKGLLPALENLVQNINRAKKIEVLLKHNQIQNNLDNSTSISLYRIVQESLNNMIKHAGASRIEINIVFSPNECLIKINDNGKGFNTAKIHESEGLGWNNLFTRVNLLKGQCQVQSSEGKGTLITIKFIL